jgi:hypothetical protein
MDPKIWGPSAWALIHSIAFNRVITVKDLNVAKHMIYSFLFILPCDKCRRNFDRHLVSLPMPNDVSEIPRWSYEIHKRISGNEQWMSAKEKWEGHVLTWKEIYPLLVSIGATHPSLRSIDSCYLDNLYNFVRAIAYFMEGTSRISKQDLASRSMYKRWVEKIRKRYASSMNPKTYKCTDYCLPPSRF